MLLKIGLGYVRIELSQLVYEIKVNLGIANLGIGSVLANLRSPGSSYEDGHYFEGTTRVEDGSNKPLSATLR